MENFIGCLVSLDCGKTLGTYQGQIESIDAIQSTVTLVRLFRNGVPYQLPQVTIRSEDINDLKIIKYADAVSKESSDYSHSHASNLTSMLTATTSITTTNQTSTEPAAAPIMAPVQPTNSTKIDLPSMFSKTKYFQSLDPAKHDSYYSSMKTTSNKPYNKQHANTSSDDFIHEQTFINQSRRHKTSITPPNNFGRQHYCSELEDSFNNLNKTEDNQRQKMNKSFNPYQQFSQTFTKTTAQPGVTFTSSPNYNTQHQQQQNPKLVTNYKGSTKDAHANKNQLLKISNSFTEPYSNYANMYSHKAHESSHQSPSRKPRNTPKRNNSDCFNNCDGNFNDDFDFEKNLALFDKAAVAMEINSAAANSAQPTTTMAAAAAATTGHSNAKQQLHFNTSLNTEQIPKYKCDENILRGIKTSKRQIYFPDPQQIQPAKQFAYNSVLQQQKHDIQQQQLNVNHLILGEYKTDTELIVPGLSKNFRAKLFTTSSRWGFSLSRLIEAFGRGVCEAVMQYLGGCARFEEKNAHQRPTIAYLVGSRSWQSASAINSARHLANRSANVFLYETSPSLHTSSSSTSTSLGKKRPPQKSNSTLTPTSSCNKKKTDSDDRGGGDDNDDDDGDDEHDENEATYAEELELFQMTSGLKIKDSIDFQKLGSVDLIISTLDIETNGDVDNTGNLTTAAATGNTTSSTTSSSTASKTSSVINIIDISSKKLTPQQQQQLQLKQTNSYAIHFANSSKAPVFSIEPSTTLKETSIPYKRSFFCALPPWFDGLNVGQVSLCDPGWPVKIFNEVGLAYSSPFLDKFFVSLHPV